MKLWLWLAAALAAALASSAATSEAQAAPANEGVTPGSASTDAGAGELPAAASRAVSPPKLTRFVEAPYPESERERGAEAAVLLSVAIDAEGKVADVSVIGTAGPAFDEAALAAVKQFEFEPARVDGAPVPVRIQYRYEFSLTPKVAAEVKTTADFSGVVRDRRTHEPLAGVRVELDGVSAVTDEAGRFHFSDVAPGPHSVTLSGAGFAPTGTEETLKERQQYQAEYDVEREQESAPGEQVDFELVIVDVPLQKSVAATTVSAEQGGKVAGTGGDVIKVVENLPGVARSSVGSSALVVWGAGAADTRVYVDDVHIPLLYHEGGFRSVIHSDLVKNVELEPGGYGAAHGRGLGGLVSVGLKPLEADGYHGSLAVDAIDAAASMRASIGDDVRVAGAVRRSHLDWVLARATSKDVGEFVPIPRYWDGQLRAAWVPHEGESVEVGGLLSSDHISRTVVEADPADNESEVKNTGFERVYVRYERRLDAGGTFTATPFFGLDHASISSRFGAVPADLKNNATVYGLRTVWSGNPETFLGLAAGVDAEVTNNVLRRNGSVTTPPREGDIRVFGQSPGDQVNADTWTTTIAGLAPFAQADVALADGAVHLIPGMRLEPTVVRASRITPSATGLPPRGTMREDTFVEPRFTARWAITDHLGLRGAVGVYHQSPLPEDLSAVFGNPTLGPSKALQYLAGTNVKFTDTLSIELTGFYSQQSDLATRSPLPTPASAQALIQDGKGRAYGAQALLRQELASGFFGWLSYSLVRSQRTDGGSTSFRPFDFDQTHVLTVLASYDLGAGFEIGARFRYTTGYPRTPVLSAIYDSRTDSFAPVFGAHNSIRIPPFYEVDARISKRFKFGNEAQLELYLDMQNLTDHPNPEEIIYNFDYSRRSYITGLPFLPVLGAKMSW